MGTCFGRDDLIQLEVVYVDNTQKEKKKRFRVETKESMGKDELHQSLVTSLENDPEIPEQSRRRFERS